MNTTVFGENDPVDEVQGFLFGKLRYVNFLLADASFLSWCLSHYYLNCGSLYVWFTVDKTHFIYSKVGHLNQSDQGYSLMLRETLDFKNMQQKYILSANRKCFAVSDFFEEGLTL